MSFFVTVISSKLNVLILYFKTTVSWYLNYIFIVSDILSTFLEENKHGTLNFLNKNI